MATVRLLQLECGIEAITIDRGLQVGGLSCCAVFEASLAGVWADPALQRGARRVGLAAVWFKESSGWLRGWLENPVYFPVAESDIRYSSRGVGQGRQLNLTPLFLVGCFAPAAGFHQLVAFLVMLSQ